MNDFSIPGASNAFGYIPSPANYIRPGKRPLSSITPTIVEHANGSFYFAVAAAGGSRIITSTLQNLWHVLDQNMTAPEALAAPRFHDQLVPSLAIFEYAYDNGTVHFMQSRGHNVTWITNVGLSSAQSVRRLSNGSFEAAGEPHSSTAEVIRPIFVSAGMRRQAGLSRPYVPAGQATGAGLISLVPVDFHVHGSATEAIDSSVPCSVPACNFEVLANLLAASTGHSLVMWRTKKLGDFAASWRDRGARGQAGSCML
ncbi:hypothetical protein LTR53_008576 [Teratosphaeriaceae sp. CCFEE 6253]|nr:hypothetical protein LTR53_008576 [Teratosphaeriaceae sp. CCFEE 6253]